MMTMGVYAVLGWLLNRLQTDGQAATPTQLPQSQSSVQIVEPLDGAVLQISSIVAVRSVVMEPGFVQAELQVDGRRVAVEVKEDPQVTPWIVQWVWEDPGEGSHVLVVQANGPEGKVETSAPVTVTVVPEGRLAFASNRNGAYAVYDMQTDGGDLIRLTSGPGSARQPALGQDGTLAYVTESEGGRSVIRMLVRDEEEGVDLFAGVEPAWAFDGARLAYSANVEGVSQVYVAALDRGAPEQVTVEDAYAGQPTWSPDGTRLAYVVEQEGNWDIWIAALDGGESRRLTKDPAMDWAPSWSPDGSKLAFVSDRGGSHQIYIMQTDGTKVRVLSDLAAGAEAPTWSPDGFWLAFVAYTGEGAGINAREIHLVRSDGQNQIRLTHNAYDDTGVDWQWSP
jgi:Tol biopolymer transport system component